MRKKDEDGERVSITEPSSRSPKNPHLAYEQIAETERCRTTTVAVRTSWRWEGHGGVG